VEGVLPSRASRDTKQRPSAIGSLIHVWSTNHFRSFQTRDCRSSTQPSFSVGKPRMLFEGRYQPTPVTSPNYDVSHNGQRFLMLKPAEQAQAAPTQINVVLNWFEELKRRVPTGTR
jgi:hypothetical protein